MHCLRCHAATRPDARFCSRCGAPLPDAAPPPSTPDALARLPSLLAIPLQECLAEAHPVLRLHRLCDAVEILTRFCTVLALGELRARLGDAPLPDDVLAQLQPRVERPTFGQWRDMLQALLDALGRGDPLVVPELPDFASRHLLPALHGDGPRESLLALRNDLAHGGAMPRAAAGELLAAWQPWLDPLPDRLAFFHDADVCHYAGGAARRLAGPDHRAAGELPLAAELRQALDARRLDGHVVLLRQGRWLDLWPLCDYGRAVALTPEGPRPARADSPMVYLRAEPRRLRYVALGADWPYGERPRPVVDEFRRLFQLDARLPDPSQPVDFEQEMRTDAAALVGRKQDLAHALGLVKSAQEGVFWVSGPGGIGKSYLLARLCQEPALCGDPKKVCRIAWRFKTSDQTRGNRSAFFRYAVGKLAKWLDQDVPPTGDAGELFGQLVRLLNEAAQLTPAPYPNARAPRVLFVLDGLDEIARLDPSFVRLPGELCRPNVIWLCAGRPEGELPRLFAADVCTHVFAEGLPPMSADDIRAMLLTDTAALKYGLLQMDEETGEPGASATGVQNDAVDAVVRRAEGLPLYVRLVVEDVVNGQLRWDELERKLPHGLVAYYNELLRRWGLGELRTLLTPLVVTIARAKEPLEEETLLWLLVRSGTILAADEAGRQLLRRGLDAVQGLLRLAPLPGGGRGYEPYHPTFGEHLRADPEGVIGQENPKAVKALMALAQEWASVPASHPARRYALRHGPRTLLDVGRADEAAALLLDLFFLEAKTEAGLVFDLATDFTAVIEALPTADERRQLLELLEEALRRDIHFIYLHHKDYPQGLFQCLWNTCWWYDCPDAAKHYEVGRAPGEGMGVTLYRLLEGWRTAKEQTAPGFVWLRSLRPPGVHLGTAQKAVFRGHEGLVCSVAYSPDGRWIVSGSEDKTVRVWDAATGAQVSCLQGHEGAVRSVAFSPDGRRIVSGGLYATVRVWDAQSGAELICLQGHEHLVTSVAFSPDGRRLASGSWDRTVRVWDAHSGAELLRLHGHEEYVTSLAFSPDGWCIVSGSRDKTVRVWDAHSGAELLRLQGYKGTVTSVAFSPDGRHLASGSWDGTVRVWDAHSGAELLRLQGHEHWVFRVAFSPDGQRLASGVLDNTVSVWDAQSGAELICLQGHERQVTSVAFSPDGRRLASGSDDRTVRVWDAHCGAELLCLQGHKRQVTSVAFAPNGWRLASWSDDRTVRVWDAQRGVELLHLHLHFQGHERQVTSVAFSPDGRRLASGSDDRTVRVWDAQTGAELLRLQGHEKVVTSVAFSPDGRRLASGSVDRTVRVWDAHSGACLEVIQGRDDAATIAARERTAWEARRDVLDTHIAATTSGRPVAWFPIALQDITAHPTGRTWAGSELGSNYLCLFTLEGSPQPPRP